MQKYGVASNAERKTSSFEQREYLDNILGGCGCAGLLRLPSDGSGAPCFSARQTMLPLSRLETYNFFGPQECIALNTFSSTRSRSAENLLSLNALYLDLDIYKIPGQTLDEVLSMLMEYEFGYAIPEPSYIVSSGQGAYLIWLLDRLEATPTNRNLWFAVIEAFFQRTRKFGCDPKCRDIVRVLRVPGSVNSKQGVDAEVRILSGKGNLRYGLEEVAKHLRVGPSSYVRPLAQASSTSVREKSASHKSRGERQGNGPNIVRSSLASSRRVAMLRAQDIEVVLERQGADAVGHREVALFYYRHFLLAGGENAGVRATTNHTTQQQASDSPQQERGRVGDKDARRRLLLSVQ